MEQEDDEERASKAARTGDEPRGRSAFADAMEEDLDGGEDEQEGPWVQLGSDEAVQRLRHQLQCDSETSAAVVKRTQHARRKAQRAAGAAKPTPLATEQP